MELTVTLLELFVTHLKRERLLWTGFAITKPEIAVATLALHSDHINDRKIVPAKYIQQANAASDISN